MQRNDDVQITLSFPREDLVKALSQSTQTAPDSQEQRFVVDTSTLIDRRIIGIVTAGFLRGKLLILPQVMDELHHLADSSSKSRRSSGEIGLAVITALQKIPTCSVEIMEREGSSRGEMAADEELILFARDSHIPLITTDGGLQGVARVHGVQILNIHTLAYALKPILTRGDSLEILIAESGEKPGQGLGTTNEGTMVVVENASRFVGKTVRIRVDRVLRTPTGDMAFATLQQKA